MRLLVLLANNPIQFDKREIKSLTSISSIPFRPGFTVEHVDGVFRAANVDDLLCTGRTHLLGSVAGQGLHFGSSGHINGYPGVLLVSQYNCKTFDELFYNIFNLLKLINGLINVRYQMLSHYQSFKLNYMFSSFISTKKTFKLIRTTNFLKFGKLVVYYTQVTLPYLCITSLHCSYRVRQ